MDELPELMRVYRQLRLPLFVAVPLLLLLFASRIISPGVTFMYVFNCCMASPTAVGDVACDSSVERRRIRLSLVASRGRPLVLPGVPAGEFSAGVPKRRVLLVVTSSRLWRGASFFSYPIAVVAAVSVILRRDWTGPAPIGGTRFR